METSVYIEETPNPRALKFILDRTVKSQGKMTIRSDQEVDSPLVRDLLNISAVEQVHLFENVITVSQNGQQSWDDLVEPIRSVIQTRIEAHNPDIGDEVQKVVDRSQLSPELQKIEEILDRTIRPGLRADGGDVEVIEFLNNILVINFQGACGGCPSSTMETLYAIENILKSEFHPEIQVKPNLY